MIDGHIRKLTWLESQPARVCGKHGIWQARDTKFDRCSLSSQRGLLLLYSRKFHLLGIDIAKTNKNKNKTKKHNKYPMARRTSKPRTWALAGMRCRV